MNASRCPSTWRSLSPVSLASPRSHFRFSASSQFSPSIGAPSNGPYLSFPNDINLPTWSLSLHHLLHKMQLQLEWPLESLLFHYSDAIVGSICAFLALLAGAALGLWRFRSLQFTSTLVRPKCPAAAPSPDIPRPDRKLSAPPIAEAETLVKADSGEERSSKGRFASYFAVDEEIIGTEDEEEMDEMGMGYSGGEVFDLWCFERRGDLGWYRFQDMTVINGSVVRLWDSCRGGVTAVSALPKMKNDW